MTSPTKVPLHMQVATALRSEIQDHRLPPGSPMPSEAALQQRFGVARSVVRQALATLVAEGLILRGQGRGTVVAPPREHHRLVQRSSGLFAQMAAEGEKVETRILLLHEEHTPPEAAWLRTARVLRLERLRSVAEQPLAYIRTYLPAPACAGLTAEELTDASLHETLERRFGFRPTGGRRHIRAVAADAELAKALRVPTGSPTLLLEGRGTDQHGRPLEVFSTWHRADQIAFDIDVSDGTSTSAMSGPVAAHPGERLVGRASDRRTPAKDNASGSPRNQEPAGIDRQSEPEASPQLETPSDLQEAANLAQRLADVLARIAGDERAP